MGSGTYFSRISPPGQLPRCDYSDVRPLGMLFRCNSRGIALFGLSLACCAVVWLCCVALCCAAMCCAVLCCAVLCCAVLEGSGGKRERDARKHWWYARKTRTPHLGYRDIYKKSYHNHAKIIQPGRCRWAGLAAWKTPQGASD